MRNWSGPLSSTEEAAGRAESVTSAVLSELIEGGLCLPDLELFLPHLRPHYAEVEHDGAASEGFHPDRAPGGDRDHRGFDRPLAAGGAGGAGGGAAGAVRQQSEADRSGDAQLPRDSRHVPGGDVDEHRRDRRKRVQRLDRLERPGPDARPAGSDGDVQCGQLQYHPHRLRAVQRPEHHGRQRHDRELPLPQRPLRGPQREQQLLRLRRHEHGPRGQLHGRASRVRGFSPGISRTACATASTAPRTRSPLPRGGWARR